MTTATINLPEKSIDWLQDLIQINLDSKDGFKEAADNLKGKDNSLISFFRELSTQRGAQASELQAMVASNAEKPTKSGSVAAAAHRTWMDIRTALPSHSPREPNLSATQERGGFSSGRYSKCMVS